MIQKFIFGNPIETDAVVQKIECIKSDIPYWHQSEKIVEGTKKLVFTYAMADEDIVYGLGESMRGINKRGYLYRSLCADDPVHTEEKTSLYGAHNALFIVGKETHGIFLDDPGEVVFDIGYTSRNVLTITCGTDLTAYFFTRGTILELIREFRTMIGRSYIPPRFGLGFGQSRWSYANEQEVEAVARGYRDNQIPIDSIYLDIDYMERYKDFTISDERFPDFPAFVQKMKKEGIHLVPIIDAGVKIEAGYPVYEEGVKKGYFCKNEDGSDFVGGVWPGRVHFPDMLDPEVRKWFGGQYQFLLEQGIDGFWNDMNEPALFYSEEHLKEVFDQIEAYKDKNLDINEFFAFTGMVSGIANNHEDYKRFYHQMNGKRVRHDAVHNLYGFNMTRAAGEAFEELEPDRRILMFSRSSYIGMHRYGGIWTGDNQSWWSHILLSMKQMVGLNMCGFLYAGSDLGGFGANATEDLVLRFTEYGLFTPLMRNHSAAGTRHQEAYSFENTENFKNIISLRYFFLPYLYSEYMRAALNGEMYFYPMAFLYPNDLHAGQVEDQLFVGQGMMIAPVYTQNATGRYVYLPECMKMYRFRSPSDFDVELFESGHHYVDCALNEVLVFVRPGYILPCSDAAMTGTVKNADSMDLSRIVLLSNAAESAHYLLYTDDGYEKDYENASHFIHIDMDEEGDIQVTRGKNAGEYAKKECGLEVTRCI